ncbi:tetratricopeptide repeat-containing diguanylate cyclase [Undibacterium cyanobacteriorum]|uniref:diguanylate cyclase n=1 Tax=Undibacterium cyanobacteriorum TaxID=3073561 RepID=A0ABY9RG44_9BURK|nr:tetratricopeptide repeat-containing diguanylate cyclase [Undibacterium sp. 20NA77.5]WMW80189.1 tetratricopeptide repeat-containing diguanylate cyclase [Undibacterium sp. 20NA77.5]
MMDFGQQFVIQNSTLLRSDHGKKDFFLLQSESGLRVILQLILPIIFLLLLSIALPGPVHAADDALAQKIHQIQDFSDRNNEEGIKQLQQLKQNLPPNASAQARLNLIEVLSGLLYDAGRVKEANALYDEYKSLAQQLNDKETLVLISIFDAFDVYEKSGFDAANEHLDKLAAEVEKRSSVVRYRYAWARAQLSFAQGKFDGALKQYLLMLDLIEQLPRRQLQARMYTWQQISNLYLSGLKDAKKSYEATTEALAVSSALTMPKAYVEILIVRGAALSQLKRNHEALKEYDTALGIARQEGLPFAEAAALFNIADQYLILKDYRRAEQAARDSIAVSERLEDKFSKMGAQVNLGLALAYQGKIKQGVDLVNESIEFFRKNSGKQAIESINGELAAMYESAGMYKEALVLMHEKQALSEELYQAEQAKESAKLQEEFNAEQRKKQIELLGKDNALKDADIRNHRLRQMVTLLASIIAALAGCFIYMLYRRSKKLNAQLREMNTQLEFHAVRDPLTGLHNRRSFITLMSTRVARVENERREGPYGNPDCMILLDIDHFKHINDTWGHSVGDMVLKEVATRLRSVVRDEDMVMRWGGEEFLIFSPKSNPEQITNLVERVLRTIGEDTFMHGNLPIPVTVTAGFISVPFSDVPEDICDWERALQIADMALYLGKTHGRNRAYGLAKLLVPHEDAIPTLTHDLAAAIKQNMVEVIEVLGPPQTQAHV